MTPVIPPRERPLWWLNLPDELWELPQWVGVMDGEKCPMNCRKWGAASSTNPATWSTLWEAQRALRSGMYDWAGFVFADNGIVGIDIDVGYEGDELSLTADHIIHLCQSYTERSRSGRGFHILVRGSLPFAGKNNQHGVEIYQTGRYFITTGDTVFYGELRENQSAIDAVVAAYFAEEERKNARGPQSQRIYNPVWPAPRPGHLPLRPAYPRIGQGGRNLCLTSLAGSLHTLGYPPQQIYEELCRCNAAACDPPLPDSEVQSVTRSVCSYVRGESDDDP